MRTPSRNKLISLAGERVFKRGEDYYVRKRVRALIEYKGKISAIVDGTRSYRVSLRFNDRRIGYDCSCPEGVAGRFCKHCIAVCLSWIESKQIANQQSADPDIINFLDVHAYLDDLPHGTLAELLLDEAAQNTQLRERLSLRAARLFRKKPDLSEYRRVLDFASQTAAGAEDPEIMLPVLKDVETSLNNLLAEGYAEEVITLTEEALTAIFGHLRPTDAIGKLILTLYAVHLTSCRRSISKPEEVVNRLFDWHMRSIAGVSEEMFAVFEQTYSELLEEEEPDIYRQFLEAVWKRLQSGGGAGNPKLRDMARIMRKLKRRDEFVGYAGELRKSRVSQRNFVKMIDKMMSRYYRHEHILAK